MERACLTFFLLLFLKLGVLTDTRTEGQLGSGEHSSRDNQRLNPEGILPPEEDGRPRSRKLSVLLIASMYIGHQFPLTALGEELVRRGHHVVMLGPVMEGSSVLPKLPESVGIKFIESGKIPQTDMRKMSKVGANVTSFLHMLLKAWKSFQEVNTTQDYSVLTRRAVEQMNASEWDYAVVDISIGHVMYTILKLWGADKGMINYSPLPLLVPLPPWPFPAMMAPFSDNMSFWDRLVNSLIYYPMHKTGELLAIYLIGLLDPGFNVSEVDGNIMMDLVGLKNPVLLNTVIGFAYPKTILPLQHYVGPMFLKKQPKLSPDLHDWLKGKPKQSVIYISMGSTAELTPLMAQALLGGVVAETEYSMVWALRESNRNALEGVDLDPERVFLASWVAQFSLLQHPSIAMAILHCGIGGVQEALYHQIPVICLPYGFDQFDTALRLETQGLGIRMLPNEVSREKVVKAVTRVKTGEFSRKVERMSKLLRSGGGAEKAADLVELYAEVGHHHGIPAFVKYRWSWVQYYNVDVWVVMVVIMVIVGWVSVRLCRCCCGSCCRCKHSSNKTKQE